MSRYLQKISLRPYEETHIWVGWDIEDRSGEIDGLLLADDLGAEELQKYGVVEFLQIPSGYVQDGEFVPRKRPVK